MSEESESNKIRKEIYQIVKARHAKMEELMAEYDKTVYYPARKSLIERCGNIGHRWNFHDTNPVGWPVFFCNQCGATDIRKE